MMPISVDRYEALAEKVLDLYREAEVVMMRKVDEFLKSGSEDLGWAQRKYAEMHEVNRQTRSYMEQVTKKRRQLQEDAILEAYNGGMEAFISDERMFTEAVGIAGLTPNAAKVVNILSELDSSMIAADRKILRNVTDAYSAIVGRSSALLATGTVTLKEAVNHELSAFRRAGIKGFIDNAGRHWDLASYAEMATLTAIERATREGYFDAMRENEYDLAVISDHYGACPVCEAWQGVVVSIDGKTPGYLTVEDAEADGVFHPRCMHDLYTYHEGITKGARIQPRDPKPPSRGYEYRQKQRYYERQSRKWSRVAETTRDPQEKKAALDRATEYQGKITSLISEYNSSTPKSIDHLPRKRDREV